MIDLFRAKAKAAGSEVHHFSGPDEALSFVIEFLQKEYVTEINSPTAVWADCPFLTEERKKELDEKVPGLQFNVTLETAAQAKIGISQMDWAIADTGTLVQRAGDITQRLVSMLPDIHLVLIPSHKILPDLATALSRIPPNESAYLTLVTGPSRTADIERVLTIGVHGPERLIIILVDRLED